MCSRLVEIDYFLPLPLTITIVWALMGSRGVEIFNFFALPFIAAMICT
jgi:hypothetical protein